MVSDICDTGKPENISENKRQSNLTWDKLYKMK